MKRYISLLLMLPIAMSGCKKFLEESSQNQLRPKTTSDLAQTLLGEGYPFKESFHSYIDLISDDVETNFIDDNLQISFLNQWSAAFLWKKTMFEDLVTTGATGTLTYEIYYKKIKGCNVVMDNLEKVSGTISEKNNVKAEALFLRSFYYFNLVNLFAKPYGVNGTVAESDLGVPLILSAEVTRADIKRATIAEVYRQIESDLLISYELISSTPSNVYHPGKAAVALLLSRFYLYQRQWDKSIDFASKAIELKSTLKNLNEVAAVPPSGFTGASSPYQIANGLVSPEVIWSYGDYSDYDKSPLGKGVVVLRKTPFSVSASLSDLYESNDRRAILYFTIVGELAGGAVNWYKGRGGKYNAASSASVKAFRTAEAYLNRTEANLQKSLAGDLSTVQLALNDLNQLRSNRITAANYQDLTLKDPVALYTFYQSERRRELCFEDQRWFDLRRWNLSVTHSLQISSAVTETVTLQPGDGRFTLPIPQAALLVNPDLIPNP